MIDELIKAYAGGKIKRSEFCRELAKAQGFDNTLKSYGDNGGLFAMYRGREARIFGALLFWVDNGRQYSARTFKEMKIKIDIAEMRCANG